LEGDKEKMRKLRKLGVAGGAALLAAALIVPSGSALAADPQTVTDQYGAAASGEVLDIHLLGRHVSFGQAEVQSTLDAVTRQLSAEAKGLGTLIAPASVAVARFNDPAAPGGKACAVPDIAGLLGQAGQAPVSGLPAGLSLGGLLPSIQLNVGCGEATVGGNAESFMAESVGGLLQVRLAMPEVVKGLIAPVRQLVGSLNTGGVPVVGGLLGNTQPTAQVTDTVNSLNGMLGGLLGNVPVVGGAAGGVTGLLNLNSLVPALDPAQTVNDLLAGIEQGDLLRINLGVATARNAGDLQSYLSQAVSEGGSIEILPNFGGVDKALLKIEVLKSTAKVMIDRAKTMPEAVAEHTLVRVSSPLLPDLSTIPNLLSGVPIVGGLLGSTGLPVADSVVPVVNGLLGGVPVVNNLLGFDATIKGLGLKAGPGYVEIGPGMSVSILCDGLVAPLCTEISVGAVKPAEVLANGRTRIESSAATIHALKNINSLGLPVNLPVVSGLSLGTILGSPLVGDVLNPLLGAAGLSLGEPSDVPGIKISLAHAVAEAGGVKVLGAVQERARDLAPVAAAPADMPTLPRTGGLPVDATAIPVLLGASAGLRALVRRRRDS
jgi:hypothetical protein